MQGLGREIRIEGFELYKISVYYAYDFYYFILYFRCI